MAHTWRRVQADRHDPLSSGTLLGQVPHTRLHRALSLVPCSLFLGLFCVLWQKKTWAHGVSTLPNHGFYKSLSLPYAFIHTVRSGGFEGWAFFLTLIQGTLSSSTSCSVHLFFTELLNSSCWLWEHSSIPATRKRGNCVICLRKRAVRGPGKTAEGLADRNVSYSFPVRKPGVLLQSVVNVACAPLARCLNILCLSFLVYKVEIIIVPVSWGCRDLESW